MFIHPPRSSGNGHCAVPVYSWMQPAIWPGRYVSPSTLKPVSANTLFITDSGTPSQPCIGFPAFLSPGNCAGVGHTANHSTA
eukprot:117583-Rhodomonas_salina.2